VNSECPGRIVAGASSHGYLFDEALRHNLRQCVIFCPRLSFIRLSINMTMSATFGPDNRILLVYDCVVFAFIISIYSMVFGVHMWLFQLSA